MREWPRKLKNVNLTVRSASDGSIVEKVSAQIEEGDITLFKKFVAAVDRVRKCKLLDRGMSGITNINFTSSDGVKISYSPVEDFELFELLHVLRPVILERENVSFQKISSLVKSRYRNENVSKYVKSQAEIFSNGELQLYLQISINGNPVLNRTTINNWLNGTQYHFDSDKSESWKTMEGHLGSENSKAVIIDLLYGKVKAVLNLSCLVAAVIENYGAADT